MKKPPLFHYLLILLVLSLALPFLSYFNYSRYHDSAIQEEVENHLSVILQQFTRRIQNANGDEARFLDDFSSFLERSSSLGSAILFDGDLQIVFPDRPDYIKARADLIEHFTAQIQAGTMKSPDLYTSPSGNRYLIRFITISEGSFRVRYCVAYAKTELFRDVFAANGRHAMLPSILLSLLIAISFLFLYGSWHSSLRNLRAEIDRIGEGNLSPIVEETSLRDMEKLRVSLNRSLEALRGKDRRANTIYLSVSHRMRNLLSSIQGYAQGIQAGVFSPEEAAGKILAQSRRVTELESNFSHYVALSDLRRQEPETEILSPEKWAEGCLENYRPEAEEKGVSLSLRVGDGDLAVRTSAELLEAVADNLLSNAVRYAASAVTVSVGREDGRIFLRVEDDGPGISEADLSHIFEPLYKGKGGVFGLGLAVADQAANLLGGSLTAENRPEGGAAFTLRFPAEAGRE